MFSGIVEELAEIKRIERLSPGKRFHISLGKSAKGIKNGSSVCISGCCLTVVAEKKGTATFDVMPETLRKTNFEELKEKSKVNIEKSLKLGDEVGGHFVSGHVDCTGKIAKRQDFSDFSEMEIKFPEEFSHLLIDKGSIAVDGISLTVVKAEKGRFSIALIPTTLKLTTLGFKRAGDSVNLEFDQAAKYIAKILESRKN